MTVLEFATRDPVVRAALEESGWTPDYRYDASTWLDALSTEGFTVHAAGAEALKLLGGLRITPPHSIRATFATGLLIVDPLWAATGEAERIHVRERQLGTALCPIGEWLDEYVVLAAADGRILAETTFQVLELGEDLAEALVRIVTAESQPVRLDV